MYTRATHALVMVLLGAGGLGIGCLQPDLTGRACPCIDGYTCIDGLCVEPTACTSAFDCAAPLVCTAAGICAAQDARCPARFTPDDVCPGTPPARSTLVAVCDDGTIWEEEMTGLVNGELCGVARLTREGLSGTLDFDAGSQTVSLNVSGAAHYRVEIESACVAAFETQGCVATTDVACAGDAAGCTCNDVEVAAAPRPDMTFTVGHISGADTYVGCAQPNGTYTVRRTFGPQRGAILVFE